MRKVNLITFDLVKQEFKGTKWDEIPKGSLVFATSTRGVWNNREVKEVQAFKIMTR